MRLQHPLLGTFADALIESFDSDTLTILLLRRFGLKYDALTNANRIWGMQATNVLDYFHMHNTTEQLVAAARDARPDVPQFAIVADAMGYSAITGSLEVLTQRPESPYQDVEAFRAAVATIEAAVCRIETTTGKGTGTLIAPNTVLTNRHVVAKLIDQDGKLTSPIRCRFDYKTNGKYTTPETIVTATAIRAASPHDAADLTVGPMTTNPAALDYALLQLDRAIGDLPVVAGGNARGFVDISSPPTISAPAAALILQHPGGKPMKIDMAVITSAGAVRFRHDLNTEPGSSGAPLIDGALRMIGIHHAGQNNGPGNPLTYNQGIPLEPILADARSKGVEI